MARSSLSTPREVWDLFYNDPTYDMILPFSSADIIRSGHALTLPTPFEYVKADLTDEIIVGERTAYDSVLVSDTLRTKRDKLIRNNGNDRFDAAVRRMANPFHDIGSSIFLEGGIEIANIDAIFNFGSGKGGYCFNHSAEPLVFLDLGGSPGEFTQYVQWRYHNAFGYGVALSSDKGGQPWDKNIDFNRFSTTYCMDGTGDVVGNTKWLTDWIMKKAVMSSDIPLEKLRKGRGVDLVYISPDRLNRLDRSEDELKSFRSYLAKVLIAFEVLWNGGTLIVKFGDLFSVTADLVYIITQVFDYVTLFNPISVSPGDNIIYLIANGFRRDNQTKQFTGRLAKAVTSELRGRKLQHLLPRPSIFNQQLKEMNDLALKRQIAYWKAVKTINRRIKDDQSIDDVVPHYLNYYATVYWNVPN